MANISGVENMQKKLEGSLKLKMSEFEERLKAASTPTNLTLIQLHNEYYSFKELVTSMLKLLQQQIQDCIKGIDHINMHKRRKALVFNGVAETSKEDISQKVLLLLHEKMGLSNVDFSSIKNCFRLYTPNNNQSRPIVVYFCEHHIKPQVWNSKSKLKGSAISVSEFLTKSRQSVHKNARNHFGIKNFWSFDGAIYIKVPEGRAKITTQEELDNLMVKFPNLSSSQDDTKSPGASQDKEPINVARTPSAAGQSEKVQRQKPSSIASMNNVRSSRRLATKK